MNDFGKILFLFGLAIAGCGLLIWSGFGRSWLGRLPGDVNITRSSYSFHFPIVTCLLLTILLNVILWLFRR